MFKKFRGVTKCKKNFSIKKGQKASITHNMTTCIINTMNFNYVKFDSGNSFRENRNTKEYLR